MSVCRHQDWKSDNGASNYTYNTYYDNDNNYYDDYHNYNNDHNYYNDDNHYYNDDNDNVFNNGDYCKTRRMRNRRWHFRFRLPSLPTGHCRRK